MVLDGIVTGINHSHGQCSPDRGLFSFRTGSGFDKSLLEFRQFLGKNGYPEKVVWVTARDILLSGRRLIYVKVPVPDSNENEVRQLFDAGASEEWGILLDTICETKDATYANAWSPRNADEAERNLMHKGVKMSVRTREAKVPGEAVRSSLRWLYLRLKLRGKQQAKHLLFDRGDSLTVLVQQG